MGLARLMARAAALFLALSLAAVAEARPTNTGGSSPFRYDPGDVVEHHDPPAGDVRIHFTREGTHAVPAADTNASGTPDFVEAVGAIYEDVAEVYHDALGFARPHSDATLFDNGGDGRFDVYLLDFAHQADGAFRIDACLSDVPEQCIGHVVQENDFDGYGYPTRIFGARVVGSHEYFHAVQAAYHADQGPVFGEGTAVWATDAFDPVLGEVAAFSGGYLDNPDRSLDVPLPGPVDRFSYGSAIFFQFLSERYDDEGVIRLLWEHVVPGEGLATSGDDPSDPWWLHQVDAVLETYYESSFAEAFVDFAVWNLHTGTRADPGVAYADGARYPLVAMEALALPNTGERYRHYYAATRYFDVATAGRDPLHVALVDPEGDGSALADLHLLVAVRTGGAWSVTAAPALETGPDPVAVGGAERVVILVVNTARDGVSRRPWLCAGTETEVAACRAEHGVAEAPEACPDTDPCDAGDEEPIDAGCACAAASAATPAGPLLLLTIGLGLAAGRRRDRNRRRRG
jgi:MYXO-CTERM domain-containing protein